jgi:hypothetical protein
MTTQTTTKAMIQVGSYATRSDSELAQMLLWAAGIPYVLRADDAGRVFPFDLSGGARLFVDEPDADDAAVLLRLRNDERLATNDDGYTDDHTDLAGGQP